MAQVRNVTACEPLPPDAVLGHVFAPAPVSVVQGRGLPREQSAVIDEQPPSAPTSRPGCRHEHMPAMEAPAVAAN